MTKKKKNVELVKKLSKSVVGKLIDATISGKGWVCLQSKPKEKKPQIKCTLCDKVFSSEQYMKGHRTIVHKQKEFACRVCDVKFQMIEELKAHINIVHPETQIRKRPAEPAQLICTRCSKTFKTKEEMCHHDNMSCGSAVSTCEDCDLPL